MQKQGVLIKWEGERERARMLQRLGVSRAIKHWNDAGNTMSVASCSSSMACDREEVCSGFFEENAGQGGDTSEASWTAVTKGKEKCGGFEPEGEAESPEATVPWNEAEGVSMNLEGEGRHEQVRTKNHKEGKRKSSKDGRKGRWKGTWRRFRARKRKVIREESEETKDHVRDTLNVSRDEAEEISFVPSGISIPRRSMFCDTRCSDNSLSFWQFASVVVEEGEESHTANSCQQCYNKNLMAKGEAPLTKWQWYAVVEKKAHRGRLWRMLGKDQYLQGIWEYFSFERLKSEVVHEGCRERKAGRDPRPMAA